MAAPTRIALWLVGTIVIAGVAIAAGARSDAPARVTACVSTAPAHAPMLSTVDGRCPRGMNATSWSTSGTRGPRGVKGDAGTRGAVGPIGAAGPVGATGPAGVTGPAGATGPAGPSRVVIARRSVGVPMPTGTPVSIAALPVEAGKAYLLTGVVYAVPNGDVMYCSIGVATNDDVTGPAQAWSATAPNLNPPDAGSFTVTGAWTGGAGTATLWCTKTTGSGGLDALSGSQLIATQVGEASVVSYP